MDFAFHPFMLLPAAAAIWAVIMLVNRKNLIARHKRAQEKSRLPNALLPFHADPSGQIFTVAGVIMLVMSLAVILVIGTGEIEL